MDTNRKTPGAEARPKKTNRPGWGWWILLGLALLWISPRFLNRGYGGADIMTACCANLKNIFTAVEMYSADHRGKFPTELSQLVPEYLSGLPTCPLHTKDYGYLVDQKAKNYTIYCYGKHSVLKKIPGYPQFSNSRGLIRPPQEP